MADGNLLNWSLFRNNPEILRDYSEVHVFNNGTSAFLIKNNKLYAYGASNPCFDALELFVPNKPNELRFLDHYGVKQIATGKVHAVLLDCNDIVYCWGCNIHGQLGAGNTPSNLSYKKQNLSPIKQISCGERSTLALSYENEVWLWGLTYQEVYIRFEIWELPTRITLPDHVYVESITAGRGEVVILDSKGTVYVWGIRPKPDLGPTGLEFELKLDRLIDNCKNVIIAGGSVAFVTENGQFYIGYSHQLVSEFREICIPGTIVSIAAVWCTELFAIKNDKGEIWTIQAEQPRSQTIFPAGLIDFTGTFGTQPPDGGLPKIRGPLKTEFKNIIEPFRDISTPNIRPESNSRYNKPGIIRHMPLHFFNHNIDTVEEGRPAQDANQIELTSNISKIVSSDSNNGGYMNVSEYFNEEVCSDVTIKLSDESIHAHKLVLYVKSKHFKSLIEKSSKDMTMVDMSNWTSRSYKAYIKYLYKGKLEIEAIQDIPEIFSLAEQDTNEKLKLECGQLWRMNLKPNNVVHLFHSAFNYQQQMLMQECGPLLQEHLPKIVVSDEYIKLPEPVKLSLALTAALLRSS